MVPAGSSLMKFATARHEGRGMLEPMTVEDVVIRNVLVDRSRQAKPLTKWVGTILGSGLGKLTAWAPRGTSSQQLAMFDRGPGHEIGEFDPRLEACRSFLARHDAGMALIEDQLGQASDGWLKKHEGEFHCVGDVVYHVIRQPALKEAKPFDGELSRGDASMWWATSGVLLCPGDHLLQSLVSRTFDPRSAYRGDEFRSAWFAAYDGDGYIEWSLKP